MSETRSPGDWNLAVRQQAALAHLGQVGLRTGEVEALVHEALLTVADTIEVPSVALFQLIEGGSALRAVGALHDRRPVPPPVLAEFRIPGGAHRSMIGYAIVHDRVVASADVLADDRFDGFAISAGVRVRSAVAVPIAWGSRTWGALTVGDPAERTWTDDEQAFVQAVAGTLGLALRRAEVERQLRDSTARLDLSLTAGGLGAWSWQLLDDRLSLNGSALAMFGLTTADFGGTTQAFLALVHPDDRPALVRDARRLLDAGLEQRHRLRIIRPDTGETRWVEAVGRLLPPDGDGREQMVGVCSDVTERRRSEQLQQAVLESEHRARVEAEGARERLRFLAEASAVLTDVLDPAVTLDRLADLCVPRWADVCFVDVVDEHGDLVEVSGRGRTEGKLLDARALRRRRRELGKQAPTSSGHLEALASEGVVYSVIDDAQLEAAASDPDHLALLRRFQPRSTILAPLLARGQAIGVLTLVRTGDAEPFTEADDLPYFVELAGRAALAVENGRLFAARNRVARSLQDALLPPSMPKVHGLELAARYQVADADVEIGGDLYDVIRLGAREWGLVVGDVCGRGPDAAALTGLVRHTLRTAVLAEHQPAAVLAQANEAMLQQIDDSRFCTVAYAQVSVGDRGASVTVASAGHPRPVLVRADGQVELVACEGTLLGVLPDLQLDQIELELAPGDALVLYTDGVTEARQGAHQFGEGRLLETLRAAAGGTADDLASALEEAVRAFRGRAHDDTAILVARAAPRP